jgi:hypothetical protein
MNLYSYEGPVMEFDKCVAFIWKASTYAPSEKKARSNMMVPLSRQRFQK